MIAYWLCKEVKEWTRIENKHKKRRVAKRRRSNEVNWTRIMNRRVMKDNFNNWLYLQRRRSFITLADLDAMLMGAIGAAVREESAHQKRLKNRWALS